MISLRKMAFTATILAGSHAALAVLPLERVPTAASTDGSPEVSVQLAQFYAPPPGYWRDERYMGPPSPYVGPGPDWMTPEEAHRRARQRQYFRNEYRRQRRDWW